MEDLGCAGWGRWSCLDLFLDGNDCGYGYEIHALHTLHYTMSMHVMTFITRKIVSTRSNSPLLQNTPITTTTLLPEPDTLYSPSRSASMSPNTSSFEWRLTSIGLIFTGIRIIRLRQHNRNSTLLLNDLPEPLNKRTPPLTKLPTSKSIQYPS